MSKESSDEGIVEMFENMNTLMRGVIRWWESGMLEEKLNDEDTNIVWNVNAEMIL